MEVTQFACLIYGIPEIDKDEIETYIREIADHAPIPNVTINYGVYMHIDKTLPVSAICGRGFMAIKNIRGNYESNVSYYTAEMREKQIRSRQLESDFEGAVANRELWCIISPSTAWKTEKIIGAWRHWCVGRSRMEKSYLPESLSLCMKRMVRS